MLKNWLVKMFVLVLCPVFLVAVQTLTIDSQLGTSIEDCFDRLSIGEQLPSAAIYRNVSELTTRECESLCKQDKQCQTYDYGVGAKGNATCNLSNVSEKEIKEKNLFLRHPDYDIYVRRFQCEQSPPTPLQLEFDDPGGDAGPVHRPIFRPDEEDPRRPLEDYVTDSRPFETVRPDLIRPIPPYRPYHLNYLDNERPDDYLSQKPALDNPPSYGDHRPQSVAFRPQNNPYKPSRPNQSHRPDAFDVFQIQDPHRPTRPLDPGFWRPDPYHPPQIEDDVQDLYGQKPNRPHRPHVDPYDLEKPVYHYIVRPNRKPKPPVENNYNKPLDHHSSTNPYGTNSAGPPEFNRPTSQAPRPIEKPTYSYNSQYASNYGQDNTIYVEIYDPPRPYRPVKPDKPSYGSQSYGQDFGYGQQSTGYGSSQSGHSSLSQSSHHSQGTITEIPNNYPGYNRPHSTGYGQTSAYGVSDASYGSQGGYGSQDNKPNVTKKPLSHNNQGSYSSQSSYGGNEGSYSNQSYSGSNGPSYGSQGSYTPTTQRPQRPFGTYGSGSSNQGLYGSQDSYPNKPHFTDYFEHHGSHYSSHESSSQSYGVSHGGYRPIKPERPIGDYRPGYGAGLPQHSSGSLANVNRPGYGNDRPTYGNDRPTYDNDRPTYGNDRPTYDNDRPTYGNDRPTYGNDRPTYGNDRPTYDNDRPTYGNDRPTYGNDRPTYGNDRPTYGNRPSYDNDRPSYGINRPHENVKPVPKPTYDIPSYGNNRPSNANGNSGSYGGSSYDANRPDPPSFDNGPSYNNQGSSGYGSSGASDTKPIYKPRPNQTEHNVERPNVKPVYENSNDRPNNVPSYIVKPSGEVVTSRPVTVGDYGAGYGRGSGQRISYEVPEPSPR